MKIKPLYYILAIVTISILIACSSDDNSNGNDNDTFSVKTLLEDEYNLQILPTVNNYVTQTSALQTAITNYTTTPTEALLETAKTQWKTTALAYEKNYGYYIGALRDIYMHQSIYSWPITTQVIENVITDNTEITDAIFSPLSPLSKSMAAAEYLLFKSTTETTNQEFLNSENRRTYLKLVGDNLNTQALRLQSTWDGYKNEFINSDAKGIDGSFNKFFNALHNMIDTGKITKIGKPAGLENSQVVNPEITQAFYSNTSLNILKANMETLENAYFNPQGLGIDDYVFYITKNNELNSEFKSRINAVNTAINLITVPLHQAIFTQKDKVKDLHEKLEAMRVMYAVDLRSVLSIIITSTDVDGD